MDHDPDYFIEKILKRKWNNIRGGLLTQLDEDRVYIVDGRERSGKSLFTLQQAYYIDPSIIEPEEARKRIVFTADDFLKAIRETNSTTTETKVIIFDEAFRGLSSRTMMSRTNKAIIQALMEMGQQNLVVFIVLPSFFMLDLYPAMLRSSALFHIKRDKRDRKQRSFQVYNYAKKSLLYQIGVRKGWQYKLRGGLRGRFRGKWPGGPDFEKLYRSLKKEALEEMPDTIEKVDDRAAEVSQKAKILKHKQEESGMSQRELAKWWEEVTGQSITQPGVGKLLQRVANSS